LNQIENEYKGRMKAGEDAEGFRKQEPLVDQIGLRNQAEAFVSKLRRQRREEQLRADRGWQERVKGIDQQIEAVMREVNRGANNPGIAEFTGDPNDEGKFRTPSLRNVALTGPYMHDGSIPTLDQVIRAHYAQAGRAAQGPNGPSPMRSSLIAGFGVTDQEVADLVAFLNSLTDEAFIRNPKHANPWTPSKRN
jgi:cytochrome c peroxidase